MDRRPNILILGTIRDGEKVLEEAVKHLEYVFTPTANLRWLIIESDSSDGTLQILKKLKASIDNFNFFSLGNLSKKIPSRPARIGYCRQFYLTHLMQNRQYDQCEYFVVADMDGVNKDLTRKTITSVWRTAALWDAVFANQPNGYYDLWALRHPTWMPMDPYITYQRMIAEGQRASAAYFSAIISKIYKISVRSSLIEVTSAFGGIGIYKAECFKKGSYIDNANENNRFEICEHVIFNNILTKKGYRLYINPEFVNSLTSEHIWKIKLKYTLLLFFGERFFGIIKSLLRRYT